MTLWKVNEKHLNCMITQEEIREMGFELSELQTSKEKTDEFLNAILENGKKLFELDTKEGIKSFNATLLQNKTVFLSISCAGPDEEIDKSLDEINSDMQMIKELTSEENIKRLKELTGEQKAQEFGAFVAQLKKAFQKHNKPMEQIEIEFQKEEPEEEKQSPLAYNIKFPSLDHAIDFCHYYDGVKGIKSSLFKHDDEFYLTADFEKDSKENELTDFVLRAEEFGGEFNTNPFLRTVMEEHGSCIIAKDALGALKKI